MEGVDADDRLRGVGAGALGVAGTHVHQDRLDLRAAFGPQLLVELVADGGAGALGAPHDLTAPVIGHESQVAVALA